MTLQERLTETHARATRLYLQRQQVEAQRQAIAQQAQALDLALVRTDGEVELLERLIAEGKADGV